MEDLETLNLKINDTTGYAEGIRAKFNEGRPNRDTILFLVANIYGDVKMLDIHRGCDLTNPASINKDEWEEIKKFGDELFQE